MKIEKYPPTNPRSIKTRFAIRFLRVMKKLNENTPSNSPATTEKYKRYRIIRASSYASMASAVGHERAWSRAVLRKIRNHKLHHSLIMKKTCRTHCHGHLIRRRGVVRGIPRNDLGCDEQENDLRELVPGGERMDSCSLLYETADYIKCLRAQVQVMTSILDHFMRK